MENNVPRTLAATQRRRPAPRPVARSSIRPSIRSLALRRELARGEVERLVRAAFAMIERSGGLDPKVSDILAEAGLSNQAFYRHFRSKHELLVAVLDEGIRGLAEYLAARMATAGGPVPAIREWVRGMAAQAQDPAGAKASRPFALARGRLAEAFPAEVALSRAQLTAPLRDALADAREAGQLADADPEQDAEALYHLMMGWIEARLVEGRIPERRRGRSARGLRACRGCCEARVRRDKPAESTGYQDVERRRGERGERNGTRSDVDGDRRPGGPARGDDPRPGGDARGSRGDVARDLRRHDARRQYRRDGRDRESRDHVAADRAAGVGRA